MCSPSAGASISSASVGRNPASVLPAPVAATSSACRPARAAASIVELMPPRRPAARGEPVGQGLGQGGGSRSPPAIWEPSPPNHQRQSPLKERVHIPSSSRTRSGTPLHLQRTASRTPAQGRDDDGLVMSAIGWKAARSDRAIKRDAALPTDSHRRRLEPRAANGIGRSSSVIVSSMLSSSPMSRQSCVQRYNRRQAFVAISTIPWPPSKDTAFNRDSRRTLAPVSQALAQDCGSDI